MTDKKWIVALDGSKGAGKSTTVSFFKKLHPDVANISLDFVRSDIGIIGTSFEKNKIAFEEVKKRIVEKLESGKNVLLDCGLNDYRIQEIDLLASQAKAKVVFVSLNAPRDILINRVTARNKAKGNVFNAERFNEVHKVVMDKDFSKFTIIDTANNSVSQVVEVIDALILGL